MQNMVTWFEIPVSDMDRAKTFYESVFKIEISVQDFGGTIMGLFPFTEGKAGASGSLIKNDAYQASETHGPLIYFGSDDVSNEIDRISEAGGQVLKAKTQISPDVGFMGVFLDTEGNRIALHSRQ